MILPPYHWYEEYWPDIKDNLPDISDMLKTLEAVIGFGERQREELRRKEKLKAQLELKKQVLNEKIRDLEDRISKTKELQQRMWCADYTVNIPIGTEVGTMEIPGERQAVNIQPGYDDTSELIYNAAKYNSERDGFLQPIWAMTLFGSGAGWFWNAAMLPGWQKWMPLWRIGVILDLQDQEDGTRLATIRLSNKTSNSSCQSRVFGHFDWGAVITDISASGLDINQTEILYNVPFQYMSCDDAPFEVDDEIIVEFREVEAQQWKKEAVYEDHLMNNPMYLTTKNRHEELALRESGVPEFIETTVPREVWVENGLGKRRDWSKPVVIGFTHDPKSCDYVYWVKVYHDYIGEVRPGSLSYDEDYFDILVETPNDPFRVGDYILTLSHPHKKLEYDTVNQMWKVTCTRTYTFDDDPDKTVYEWAGDSVWIRVTGVYNGLDTQYPRKYGTHEEHIYSASNLYREEDIAAPYHKYTIHLPYWDTIADLNNISDLHSGIFKTNPRYYGGETEYVEPVWDNCPPIPTDQFGRPYVGRKWANRHTTYADVYWEFISSYVDFTAGIISSIPYKVRYYSPKVAKLYVRWDSVPCSGELSCNASKSQDTGTKGLEYTVITDNAHYLILSGDYTGNNEISYIEEFQPTGPLITKWHYCRATTIIPSELQNPYWCSEGSYTDILYPFSMIFQLYKVGTTTSVISDFCTVIPYYERN